MPQHKVHAAQFAEHWDCSRFMFGDRWRFGIECEVQDCETDPWGSREPFGSLWLWVGGRVVGNTGIAEQLVHAFTPVDRVRSASGDRKASSVPGTSYLDKLDFIVWLRFGEDEDFDAGRWGNQGLMQLRELNLIRFEVIPPGDSPFYDGWEAALLEDGEFETFIWRQCTAGGEETHELSLPLGEFARVAELACDWFKNLRGVRFGSESRAPEGRARYVGRKDGLRFAGI